MTFYIILLYALASKYTFEKSRLFVGTDVHLLSDGGTNEKVVPLCLYDFLGLSLKLLGPSTRR